MISPEDNARCRRCVGIEAFLWSIKTTVKAVMLFLISFFRVE
jgi:hypothetical protein